MAYVHRMGPYLTLKGDQSQRQTWPLGVIFRDLSFETQRRTRKSAEQPQKPEIRAKDGISHFLDSYLVAFRRRN